MTRTVEQHILNASRIAYLLVDRDLMITGSGGDATVIAMIGAEYGQAICEVLPELYGSEDDLYAIMRGQLERLQIPEVNRERLGGGLGYLDLLSLPMIDEQHHITGLIQVITDVSDRGILIQARVQQRNEYRLLKEQVNQQNIDLARTNAELRRATQLKDEFLAGISHEVRTPLTAILGLAELTRAQLDGPLNAMQLENLQRIEESGRHLLALINDFLDIAKIEAGRFDLEFSPIPIHALCSSAVRMMAETATKKHIRLNQNIQPGVNLILGDDRRLRQALINLISNAIKFTQPGGAVGLDVQGSQEDEIVYFTVWDTGVGIAADDAQRLFQPFVQIAGEHQRNQRGSGLGLALVAQLAELHGGGIRLESKPGRGSRFTLALPWSPAMEQRLYVMLETARQPTTMEIELSDSLVLPIGNGRQILVIEDDLNSATLLSDYLQRCEYRVTLAGSADEALACVREQAPDLVISDVRIHGMDGLDLIRQLRSNISTQTLPIIALTALAMPGDRERCLHAGANVYLSKPLPLRQLAASITSLLQRADVH
ncbi:MAG: response regulator [Oscillochloris sp.]|nr:response regulator [Oscillochloris sp.]